MFTLILLLLSCTQPVESEAHVIDVQYFDVDLTKAEALILPSESEIIENTNNLLRSITKEDIDAYINKASCNSFYAGCSL